MPQFGLPSSDKTIGNYQDNAGGTTNIYQAIDEGSNNANDTDYIRSPQSPANQVYVTKLSNMVNPSNNANHVMRWRAGKDVGSGSESLNLDTELRLNYNNESSLGTLIYGNNLTAITDAWTTYTHTLTGGEADAITDYTALYMRFRFNKP